MANRKRYKDLERILTGVLLGDVAVFVLYLVFAGLGLVGWKITMLIIAITTCGLALGFLYLCGEFQKRRSRWLVLGFACIIVCMLVSLILNYPSPAPEALNEAAGALAQSATGT